MSKIMIWVGQFDSEADFEKYMDQSAFRKWWKEYDEDNKEMRCQFCKELGVMDYDEDFLIMKYAPAGLLELLNFIPADTQKINQAVVGNGIEKANVAIMYNCREGISTQKAANAVSVSFLGTFDFDLNPTGTTASTAGLKYMTWIGHTDKSETEFMEYFNQDQYLKELEDYESGQTKKRPNPEHRCQFCKDLGIKFYYPEFLRIKIDETNIMNSVPCAMIFWYCGAASRPVFNIYSSFPRSRRTSSSLVFWKIHPAFFCPSCVSRALKRPPSA